MKNLFKSRVAPAAAALAVAAAVLAGALPAARAFAADATSKVFTATAEITATYDKDGSIAVPDTELANGADFAVRLKSAKIESDHDFVSAWTNDAAGKVLEPGEKATVKWTAGSKLPDSWTRGERVRVGTVAYTYERVATDISGAKVEVADLTYNGKEQAPGVTVTVGGKALKAGTDYTVSYERDGKATDDLTGAGELAVIVTGKGDYAGTATGSFTIKPRQLSADELKAIGLDVPEDGLAYSGSEQKPAVTGVPAGLKEGADYEVTYEDNTAVGTAKATVTFKGNYTGEKTVEFEIARASVSDAEVAVDSLTYNGSQQAPTVTVKLDGKELEAGTDYTFIYKRDGEETDDLTSVGTVTVEATGKGNYSGTATGSFTIKPKELADADLKDVTLDVPVAGYTYDGTAKEPAVKGLDGYTADDYEVAYSDNVNAGTAKATVIFKGNYKGSKELTFKIAKKTVAIVWSDASYTYNGGAQTPAASVKGAVDGEALTATLSYKVKDGDALASAPSDAGTYTATATGLASGDGKADAANYALPTSGLTHDFTIAPRQLTKDELDAIGLDVPESGYTYSGSAQKPAVTGVPAGLKEGTDYDVAYSDNTDAGTAKATVTYKGNYTGSKELTFDIAKASVSGAVVKADPVESTYDGDAVRPAVTVKLDGKELEAGTDYTFIYKRDGEETDDLTGAGTVTVEATGKGNYSGTATGSFAIKPKALTKDELDAIALQTPAAGYAYDGGAKEPTVTGLPAGLKEGTDYDVAYSDNTAAGTAKATVTFKGNYEGVKELTFQIAKADIAGATVTASTSEYDYTGEAISPNVTVTLGGKTLAADTDYELTGDASATDIGSYTVGVKGKGNYSGTATATVAWTIREAKSYWLALAGADDPTANILKTAEQIAVDVEKIKADDADVIAEYTNYMNGKSADGASDQEVRLYTDWSGSDAGDGANRWVEFRIIQVGEHDDDGSGLTFMATHSLPTAKKMNSDAINDGGWGNSAMRTDVFGEGGYVQTGLSGLVAAAKTVNKKAVLDRCLSSGGTPTWPLGTTADKFWLLSFTEVYGDDFGSSFKYVTNEEWITESPQSKTPQYFRSEGSQYDWCKARISTSDRSALQRMNYTRAFERPTDDRNNRWWLRSATVNTTCDFGGVYYNGTPVPEEYAYFSNGVVPAFCM